GRRTWPTWWRSSSDPTPATSTATISWWTAASPATSSAACPASARSRGRIDERARQARDVHDAVPSPGEELRAAPRGRPRGGDPRRSPELFRGVRGRAFLVMERAHHLAADLPRHRDPPDHADPPRHRRAEPPPGASGPGRRG